MDHSGGVRGARHRRPYRRLRAICRANPAAGRVTATLVGQYRRGGPGQVRARSRSGGGAGRRCLRRGRGRVRHGVGRLRGRTGRRLRLGERSPSCRESPRLQAVAAAAGAPLGADYAVVSLSDRLKPWEVIADRLRKVSESDLVLAIYNPASRTRGTQVALAKDVLLEHRSPDTPVVIGRSVGRVGEIGADHDPRRVGPGRDRHAVPADRRRDRNSRRPVDGSGPAGSCRLLNLPDDDDHPAGASRARERSLPTSTCRRSRPSCRICAGCTPMPKREAGSPSRSCRTARYWWPSKMSQIQGFAALAQGQLDHLYVRPGPACAAGSVRLARASERVCAAWPPTVRVPAERGRPGVLPSARLP